MTSCDIGGGRDSTILGWSLWAHRGLVYVNAKYIIIKGIIIIIKQSIKSPINDGNYGPKNQNYNVMK